MVVLGVFGSMAVMVLANFYEWGHAAVWVAIAVWGVLALIEKPKPVQELLNGAGMAAGMFSLWVVIPYLWKEPIAALVCVFLVGAYVTHAQSEKAEKVGK